jgi:hypothetical protein
LDALVVILGVLGYFSIYLLSTWNFPVDENQPEPRYPWASDTDVAGVMLLADS